MASQRKVTTHATEGTRPIMLNPIPNTSAGEKCLLNSSWELDSHLQASILYAPCLYPRLASTCASLSARAVCSWSVTVVPFWLSSFDMGVVKVAVASKFNSSLARV